MNREITPPIPRVETNQGTLFRRLRWRIMVHSGSQIIGQSRVRLFTMVMCSLLVWAFVYAVGAWGFGLMAEKKIPGAGQIVGVLFDLMFFALGGMLIFSTGLISYASLFTSPETRFLLCSPAKADQIFAMKFQAAVGFSSWAFVVLCSPILISYGIMFGVPWYFYAMLPIFFIGFVILPGAVGAMISLLFVNYLPRRRKQVFILGTLLLTALGVAWVIRLVLISKDSLIQRDALQNLVGQFSLAQELWMPSHWMTNGILAMAKGDLFAMSYPLALIWSNALMLYVVTAWTAKRIYRRGYDRIATGGGEQRKHGANRLDRVMEFMIGYLDPQTKLLIMKDFRTFRRDPSQWAQILIFVGLLLLYVLNSRQFYQQDIGRSFQNGISLLNLCATSLLICAYLGRFIYPMLSLEGRKFWILGLLPLKRERLLWGKFAFAVTGGLFVSELLIILSDLVLGMPFQAVIIHALTIGVLVTGLSGISVGVSAWIPNFRETDPSKIVVGFGGTLNMIVSLFYMAVVIAVMAGPFHLVTAGQSLLGDKVEMRWWVYAGLPIGIAIGALAVWLPMRVGSRTLNRMEF